MTCWRFPQRPAKTRIRDIKRLEHIFYTIFIYNKKVVKVDKEAEDMEWSWLLTLVCPLMMIFMMFGMRGGHGHGPRKNQPSLEQIQTELLELRAENESMRKEVQALKR